MVDTLDNKGTALKHKIDHNRNVLLARINLKNEGIAGYGDDDQPVVEQDSQVHKQFVVKKKKKSRVVAEELEEFNYMAARDEFLKDEIRRLNPDVIRDEHVNAKLLEWKAVEPEYNYLIDLEGLLRGQKKRKEYMDTYKNKFVK